MYEFEQELSQEIYETNYEYNNEGLLGTIERQARAASEVELTQELRDEWFEKFMWLLSEFRAAGGGRITANLGVIERTATTLFNCFVNDAVRGGYPIDSLKGIYEQLDKQAQTLKSEGGYGTDMSHIRPKGCYVKGIGSRTPGVVAFMHMWHESSRIITMGSETIVGERRDEEKKKIRKGAQMIGCSAYHPEIFGFIDCKLKSSRLDKANHSVTIPLAFMEALEADGDWPLIFPDTEHEAYDTEWKGDFEGWMRKGYDIVVHDVVKAADLWDKIMMATFTRNEPGVLFVGMANDINPLSYAELIKISNPCGEIQMSTGVCNLMSVNLPRFYTKEMGFNALDFHQAVCYAVRFSDNINDISSTPLPEYDLSIKEKRRIGIGTLGIGSLLYMAGIPFNSKDGLDLMRGISEIKLLAEMFTSAELGVEKGSFELFDPEQYYDTKYWEKLPLEDEVKDELKALGAMRNSHHAANAPTGNMSIYLGMVSGGIEPVFCPEYNRFSIVVEEERASLRAAGFDFPDVNIGNWYETDILKTKMRGDDEVLFGEFNGVNYEVDTGRGLVKESTVMDYGYKWCKENLTDEEFKSFEDKGVFITAGELTPQEHLDSLAIFAQYTDMSISKTINLAEDISYEDFKHVYLSAYRMGIKGVTTYREGTMTAVIEKITDQSNMEIALDTDEVIQQDVKLPDEYFTKGRIVRDKEKKTWYVNIGFVSAAMERPFAIFVTSNHRESTEFTGKVVEALTALAIDKGIRQDIVDGITTKIKSCSNIDKMARMLSLLLRHNVKVIDIVDVLDKEEYPMSSFGYHIKRLLKEYIPNGTEVVGEMCPECGEKIVRMEGCKTCMSCSYSVCG